MIVDTPNPVSANLPSNTLRVMGLDHMVLSSSSDDGVSRATYPGPSWLTERPARLLGTAPGLVDTWGL